MGSSMSAYSSLYYETRDEFKLEESESEESDSEYSESEYSESNNNCNCNCNNYDEQIDFLKNHIKNLELRIILLEKKSNLKSILI